MLFISCHFFSRSRWPQRRFDDDMGDSEHPRCLGYSKKQYMVVTTSATFSIWFVSITQHRIETKVILGETIVMLAPPDVQRVSREQLAIKRFLRRKQSNPSFAITTILSRIRPKACNDWGILRQSRVKSSIEPRRT